MNRLGPEPSTTSAAGGARERGFGPAAAGWAKRSYLELGALTTAVPCARAHTRLILGEWGMADLADVAELVVSELVTNAVKASADLTEGRYLGQLVPGRPPVRLWACADPGRVLIQVWDASDDQPERPRLDLDAAGGRGLLLVETLAKEWGTARPGAPGGKAVWAICTEP